MTARSSYPPPLDPQSMWQHIAEALSKRDNFDAEGLRFRQSGLFASDMAVVSGSLPKRWRRPKALLASKLDKDPKSFPDNPKMEWGRILEPVLGLHYAMKYDVDLYTSNMLYDCEYRLSVRSKEIEWACATPDFIALLPDGKLIDLEIKVTGAKRAWDYWGEEDSKDIPLYYYDQVQWQMFCCDLWEAHIYACILGFPRRYIIPRDTDRLDMLKTKGEKFWKRVLKGRAKK